MVGDTEATENQATNLAENLATTEKSGKLEEDQTEAGDDSEKEEVEEEEEKEKEKKGEKEEEKETKGEKEEEGTESPEESKEDQTEATPTGITIPGIALGISTAVTDDK